ncbi:[FeFe] hydrogenase H-cluster radical SAM maturase HydG [Mycoplasma sp. P36-A1]|uniref:[FeFe] hydrogenase H-cluster radical SAM maturase HydG n=1 Tax=Mycoplasma sp. P36-A1 TaxID=3252900 RepID=UPI003C2E1AD5
MENFIDVQYINDLIKKSEMATQSQIESVLDKAALGRGLSHKDVAILLNINEEKQLKRLHETANMLKKTIYGDRVVLFAPLYISNYCVNNCQYCGYQRNNEIKRLKLNKEEIASEVKSLQAIGHKRLALELGEDPNNIDIDYVVDSIKTIYESGDIRRVNVNIAATSVEDYKKLHDAEIGTYILFQETYNPDTYEKQHPSSLKGDYNRQLYAHHRAIEAGLDDVGGGVLFGLNDFRFEVVAMMLHNEELFKNFGVEFHTISVPRLKPANGMSLENYPNIISDEDFVKIVSIIRVAAPYVGMILSTRESEQMRKRLLNQGISQISANSKTTVGGYSEDQSQSQFTVEDERSLLETIKDLIKHDDLPSYCTACYRMGRTGKEFHDQVASHKISQMCHPNAILTSLEYAIETKDQELYDMTYPFLIKQIDKIKDPAVKIKVEEYFERIKNGERDLYI